MFNNKEESNLIVSYLETINSIVGRENIKGEILLYITPPEDLSIIDEYFRLGVSRIACSLEVWDERLARIITPGKMQFATRKRYLEALCYITEKFGKGKAFSNFLIGVEPISSLKEGARFLASRGIIPTASVWMPMGRPVNNSMKSADIEYFKEIKQYFSYLYQVYDLNPAGGCGLNVCIEKDIWSYMQSNKGC